MFESIITCKLCGKEEQIVGWHPYWKNKPFCWECRDKTIQRHKNWLDKLHQNWIDKNIGSHL